MIGCPNSENEQNPSYSDPNSSISSSISSEDHKNDFTKKIDISPSFQKFENKEIEILEMVGQGGFALVFKSFNKSNGETYVLKRFKQQENITVLDEYKILRKISEVENENFVKFHGIWTINDRKVADFRQGDFVGLTSEKTDFLGFSFEAGIANLGEIFEP